MEIRSAAGKAHAASAQHTGQDEDTDHRQQNHRGGDSQCLFPHFPGPGNPRNSRFFGRGRNGSGFRRCTRLPFGSRCAGFLNLRRGGCRIRLPQRRLRLFCGRRAGDFVPAEAGLPLGQLLPAASLRASIRARLPPGRRTSSWGQPGRFLSPPALHKLQSVGSGQAGGVLAAAAAAVAHGLPVMVYAAAGTVPQALSAPEGVAVFWAARRSEPTAPGPPQFWREM